MAKSKRSQSTVTARRIMKHGIRPPRKSAGETSAVTIGNQERQIKVLIDRCAALEKERTDANTVASHLRGDLVRANDRIRNLEADLVGRMTEVNYSNGYIARVKEEDQRREYPPFPPASGLP